MTNMTDMTDMTNMTDMTDMTNMTDMKDMIGMTGMTGMTDTIENLTVSNITNRKAAMTNTTNWTERTTDRTGGMTDRTGVSSMRRQALKTDETHYAKDEKQKDPATPKPVRLLARRIARRRTETGETEAAEMKKTFEESEASLRRRTAVLTSGSDADRYLATATPIRGLRGGEQKNGEAMRRRLSAPIKSCKSGGILFIVGKCKPRLRVM
eukprot:Selendium_serpulae@DN1956_c0_g1_i1.p2